MKLVLVRHTSLDIPDGMCYGQMDVDVRESFQEESEKIVSEFKKQDTCKFFSSPLQRCKKLAERISGSKNIHLDERLMELDFGNWEGKFWNDLGDEARNLFEEYNINNPCPGGESFENLIDRVESFLSDLKKDKSLNSVIIVTHGGPIRAFLSLIEKVPPLKTFEQKIDYGEVLYLQVKD